METKKRTAPEIWGPWPPAQETITGAVEKAARKLAEQLADDEWAHGVIFLAVPRTPANLDCFYHGSEKEICVGYVRALGKHKSWMVYWNPATGSGRLLVKSYDPHA